ncbi:MAG: DTW domain-containing protein [Bdellovibrionales bacterium]|nr:DTW domain-containing protein [Bdellovibrionales bacterium]
MSSERIPCPRCLHSPRTCYCARLEPVRARTRFVILQHPSERRVAVGTGRLTHLLLPGSNLFCETAFETHPGVEAILADPTHHAVTLYPGAEAWPLERGSPAPEGRALTVFVFDASWSIAKKMLHRSPRLASLPRVSFSPGPGSEYRIRRQPAPHCLSTIEAVHRVLALVEPALDAEVLMRLFRHRVEAQLRFEREAASTAEASR